MDRIADLEAVLPLQSSRLLHDGPICIDRNDPFVLEEVVYLLLLLRGKARAAFRFHYLSDRDD